MFLLSLTQGSTVSSCFLPSIPCSPTAIELIRMYATFYFFSRTLDDLIVLNTHLGMYSGLAQVLQLLGVSLTMIPS
jgi:hypothetical protein